MADIRDVCAVTSGLPAPAEGYAVHPLLRAPITKYRRRRKDIPGLGSDIGGLVDGRG